MGRLNPNEPGNIHDNIGFRMGRLMGNENKETFQNERLTTDNVNNRNDTDTERDTDDGLLPKPRNEPTGSEDATWIESNNPESQQPFDVNVYQHKKTLAQGMMDLALFSANANQLRYVLELLPQSKSIFFYMSLVLIILSLFLQGMVGIGLIWNGRYDIKKTCDHHNANRANNLTLLGIFLITIINVFISAFGIPTSTQLSNVFSDRVGNNDNDNIPTTDQN